MATKRNLSQSLADSVKAAQIPPTDDGALALALRYAALLDAATGKEGEVETYAVLGPKYQAALTALGLTKAGRTVNDGKGGPANVSAAVAKRDELRERRAQRTAG
jgi:hypothetical protein